MGSGTPKERLPYVPTPEQIQLANERKAKRLAAKLQQAPTSPSPLDYSRLILPRSWIPVRSPSPSARARITIMTWNMLAQCLVRRELFPGSDCLKIKDREQMLSAEILNYGADILCLQEVDRLEALLPRLDDTYDNVFASGPGKLHGCMLLYRRSRFEKIASKVIIYDDEPLMENAANGANKAGTTRRTKNIGLMAAFRIKNGLEENTSNTTGCIVATTHLFWHPRFSYERSRQSLILLREIMRFRSALQLSDWPAFIGGDFNSQPDEATYSLLVGDPISQEQSAEMDRSRVVHISIDPSVEAHSNTRSAQQGIEDEEDEDRDKENDDPDRVIPNSRMFVPSDGLVSAKAMESLFRNTFPIPLRSAYDEASTGVNVALDTFAQRSPLSPGRKGGFEAMWTSFTPIWRLTLDYLFIWNGEHHGGGSQPRTVALLAPHKTDHLEPGLPRKGVCASDHIALAAEIEW